MKALLGFLRIGTLLIATLGIAILVISLLIVILNVIKAVSLDKSETIVSYGILILTCAIITPISIFAFITLGKKIKNEKEINEIPKEKLNGWIKVIIAIFSWIISMFPSNFLSSYIAEMQFPDSLKKQNYAWRQWVAVLSLPLAFLIYKLIINLIKKRKQG